MTWTPQMIATVKRHWGDKTAREIGELIGKSRNAVLGKVQRLGLAGPPNLAGIGLNESKGQRKKPVRIRRGQGVTGGCQWLYDEPKLRNFCGEPRRDGSAYCAAHYERSVDTSRRAA